MKCKYLSVTLRIALDEMRLLTWPQCCDEAVERVNTCEMHEHIKNGEPIRIWHHEPTRTMYKQAGPIPFFIAPIDRAHLQLSSHDS
eukprot:scaffold877_cov57-Attheya_sp.AAC.5